MADLIRDNPNQVINYTQDNLKFSFQPQQFSEKIIRRINGKRTIKDVIKNISNAKNKEVLDEFNRIYNFFNMFESLLLKSKRFPKLKTDLELQQRVSALYPEAKS